MSSRVSQKDVARAARVHPTTVSLALRDSPRLPQETKDKVKKIALELGYQPDPLLDALNAYRLAGRQRHFQGVIAWINCWTDQPTMFQTGVLTRMLEAARTQCQATGFQLEEFMLGRGGYTAARLSTVLRGRGIQGIIIPPVPGGRAHLNLKWEWFSSVAIGFSLARPELHRIANDNFNNMRTLLRGMRHQGYRRPGLIILRHENLRTDTQRLAAYQLHGQPAHSKDRPAVPVLMLDTLEEKAVVKWYRQHKPDCILVQNTSEVARILADAKIKAPKPVGLASCCAQEQLGYPGVIEDVNNIMTIAVQHVSGLIRRGETGLPRIPLRVLVGGAWTDGRA